MFIEKLKMRRSHRARVAGKKVKKAWQMESTVCGEASGPSWNVKGFLTSTAGTGELGEQEEGNLVSIAGGRSTESHGPHQGPVLRVHESQ